MEGNCQLKTWEKKDVSSENTWSNLVSIKGVTWMQLEWRLNKQLELARDHSLPANLGLISTALSTHSRIQKATTRPGQYYRRKRLQGRGCWLAQGLQIRNSSPKKCKWRISHRIEGHSDGDGKKMWRWAGRSSTLKEEGRVKEKWHRFRTKEPKDMGTPEEQSSKTNNLLLPGYFRQGELPRCVWSLESSKEQIHGHGVLKKKDVRELKDECNMPR